MRRAEDSPATSGPFWNARDRGLARRRFPGAGAAALGLAVSGYAAPSPRPARRLRLRLQAPGGPDPIGTAALHLADHSRRDPWPAVARPRELMASVRYPALDDGRDPWAPWMPPAAGKLFLTQLIPSPLTGPSAVTSAPPDPLDSVRLPVTQARQAAPADLSVQRHPIVLYSPGYGDDRELGTGLVSDLASRGYIVVTTHYTYEAAEVEFPAAGSRLAARQISPRR